MHILLTNKLIKDGNDKRTSLITSIIRNLLINFFKPNLITNVKNNIHAMQ